MYPASRGPRILTIDRAVEERFKSHAPMVLPPTLVSRLNARLDWWTIMQHYGAPTRLLDWSKSALVASYFAVHKDPKTDGTIWALDVDEVLDALARKYPEQEIGKRLTPAEFEPLIEQYSDQNVLLIPEPSILTDRMIAQQTAFTFYTSVPGEPDHDIAIRGLLADTAPWALRKYTVPQHLKLTIRENLRQMNITAAALFPGIDGLGASLSDLVADQFHLDEEAGVHRLDYTDKIQNIL
jgi:hypothetical protein